MPARPASAAPPGRPRPDDAQLSWRRALAWRMARHHLITRAEPADLARVAWALAQDVPGLVTAPVPDVARLLPGFDPWVVSAPRREPVLSPAHVRQVYRPQGWISPVMLVNGRTGAVWRHTRTGPRLTVELSPFGRLPPWARRQLETEAERLTVFAGGNLSVTWAG